MLELPDQGGFDRRFHMDPTIRRHEDDPVTDRRRDPGYDLPGERRPDTDWDPDDTDRLRDPRPGEGTAGALGGAAVGMAVGGPPGAVVGGVIGAAGGAIAGEAAEGDEEVGSAAGGAGGTIAGAAIGGAIAGPPGAVVGGAVGAGAGAGLGDQAEEEAEESDPRDR
jgi:hypothetical protein